MSGAFLPTNRLEIVSAPGSMLPISARTHVNRVIYPAKRVNLNSVSVLPSCATRAHFVTTATRRRRVWAGHGKCGAFAARDVFVLVLLTPAVLRLESLKVYHAGPRVVAEPIPNAAAVGCFEFSRALLVACW